MSRYDDLLIAEAAGKLPSQMQQDLNTIRTANAAPQVEPWKPDHPWIQSAEQQYNLPQGSLSALLKVENAPGTATATSPTNVRGLFQVTEDTGAAYGLTPLNKTNPYLNTNVAAQYLSHLLQQSNGNLDLALTQWKGPEIPDAEFLRRYHAAYDQQAQVRPIPYPGPMAGATPIPMPGAMPGAAGAPQRPETVTTTPASTPQDRPFLSDVARYAGLAPTTPQTPGAQLRKEGTLVPEPTLQNVNAVLRAPGAVGRALIERGPTALGPLAGPTAGRVAQTIPDLAAAIAAGRTLLQAGGKLLPGVFTRTAALQSGPAAEQAVADLTATGQAIARDIARHQTAAAAARAAGDPAQAQALHATVQLLRENLLSNKQALSAAQQAAAKFAEAAATPSATSRVLQGAEHAGVKALKLATKGGIYYGLYRALRGRSTTGEGSGATY